MNSTIELIEFSLNDGQSKNQYHDLQGPFNEWLKSQPGFYYRTLVERQPNQFLEVIHWGSKDEAEVIANKLPEQSFFKEMMSLINEKSVRIEYVPALSEIGYDGG